MTASGERTYGEKILQRAWDTLQPAMGAAQRSAEKRAGCKLKITDVHLVPVAQDDLAKEHREVYDVVLTMVPDVPEPAKPPEAGNASV